jgi:hypothetical protein
MHTRGRARRKPAGPLQPYSARAHTDAAMGFNKRKMDDARRQAAEKEAAVRRATEKQILEDADNLITVWNERQAKRTPMLFSPTIGAAITADSCGRAARPAAPPATSTCGRSAPRCGRDGLTPALSCRSCRPNAPFAELLCLSKSSVAREYYAERSGNKWVSE